MNSSGVKNSSQIPFWKSFKIQQHVIGALLLREMLTRYGRHNVGFLWLFLEPMLFTLGVTALWTVLRGETKHGISVVSFALTGYSTVLLWRNSVSSCIRAISPNLTLLYHQRVQIVDLFAARLLLDSAGATMAFVILTLVFIGVGWMPAPADTLTMALGWFLLAWFTVGLGLVVGSLTEFSEILDRIWHTITYLMFPLSGAMFMLDWLPPEFREFLLWVPMVHAVEMIRHGYYGDIVPTYYDVAYLSIVNTILLFSGLLLIRQLKERVVP